MKHEEALLLSVIGNGASTIEEILFMLGLERSRLDKILRRLWLKHFLMKDGSNFSISKSGLLEFSRCILRERCKKTEYSYSIANQLPYLPYENDFKRDTIFHPQLFFDPASSPENWNEQIVYEITLEKCKFDLDLLEIMSNLFYEHEYLHPTGFWVLRGKKKSVCGYGIDSLRLTLNLVQDAVNLIFTLGFQNFIILAKSVGNKIKENIRIKIYLTKDTFPYIDTLDSIYITSKILWSFLGINEVPKGHEIKLRPKHPELFLKKPLRFIPHICGKIIWKDKTNRAHEIDPYIIAFNPSNINAELSKVSPWLATCSGGFIEEDFTGKRKFSILNFDVIRLPDVDIMWMILSAGPFYSGRLDKTPKNSKT